MLAYILGITKLGIKRIRKLRQILESTNRGKRVTNIGSLRDFKLGQKKYKSGKVFQTGPKRFQIGAEITNQGKRNYKPGQGFKIGVGITNRCRTTFPLRFFFHNSSKIELQCHWKFWGKNCFFNWRRFLFKVPVLSPCILSQCLWHSIYIQVDKGPIHFITYSEKKDINYVSQLFNTNGSLKLMNCDISNFG